MSQPGQNPENPLDYLPPQPRKPQTGCLVASILFAIGVGFLSFFAIIFFLDDHHADYVAILAACPILLTILMIAIRSRGIRAALAITIISLATALLMFGLCSFS